MKDTKMSTVLHSQLQWRHFHTLQVEEAEPSRNHETSRRKLRGQEKELRSALTEGDIYFHFEDK